MTIEILLNPSIKHTENLRTTSMDSKMLDPQRVLEAKVDATMDELEADIQRRLNLIKQSLAKLDAPLDGKTTKSGIQITTYWRAIKSNHWSNHIWQLINI